MDKGGGRGRPRVRVHFDEEHEEILEEGTR